MSLGIESLRILSSGHDSSNSCDASVVILSPAYPLKNDVRFI
jgi:hypothetical protein